MELAQRRTTLPPEINRRTGRTTKMLEAAVQAVKAGHRVIVVAHNYNMARRVQQLLGDDRDSSLRPISGYGAKFTSDGQVLASSLPKPSDPTVWQLGRDTIVFVDHLVYELHDLPYTPGEPARVYYDEEPLPE
jgi:hypothetical protein